MPGNREAGDLSLLGRLGAYSQHAQYDTRETTQPARDKWNEHFVDQVDPERRLHPEERSRRVAAARKAYYTRLALKSAQARRARKSAANKHATDKNDPS
jgi:hypothetical protein